jgi:sarcosine oxidase subunit gamma
MTAVTPLEFIHKKGIFGDHHKKNESDLLKISEIKNLTIIQLVQYKRSKINISDIKIESLEIPTQSSTIKSDKETRILWNAPRTWIILSNKENMIETIKKSCKETDFAITDISHSRAVIQIKGIHAKEVLKKGSPINFNEFDVNKCVGTVFHGITIVIDSVSKNPDTFNLLVLRN